MTVKNILHMLSPLKHMSPFDVNMAADAGFDVVNTCAGVDDGDVVPLVQDSIFSRGPDGARHTAFFIGGKNALQALDWLAAAKGAMFPPFQNSVMADPAGPFTTAAAMVACVEKVLQGKGAGLKGTRIAVFGATGVVGFAAGVIAGLEGADVTLVGYDGPDRVAKAAAQAAERFGCTLGHADGSTAAKMAAITGAAEVILAAGRAGVEIVSADLVAGAGALKAAADVNAVAPAGIAGLGLHDMGAPLGPNGAGGIGPLAIGNVKYQTQARLMRRMTEGGDPLFLDFRDAFTLARTLVP